MDPERKIGPSTAMPIPRCPSDVTCAWLSAVLSRGSTPVEVAGVDVAAIGTGQTGATFRVSAKYVTSPDRLPDTFVIKLAAQDDAVRDRVTIGYDRETCWHDYRLGMPQALLISALRFAFATSTDRGDDMVLTMLGRGCQAIRDLGTLDLVGLGCA